MSKQQDTWFEAALNGLDRELGGAIGPLSEQDIVTAKAMVVATLRKSITADPAGFRKSLEANAEAAAVMMGTAQPEAASGTEARTTSTATSGTPSGTASPIRSLRQSLASGKTGRKAGGKSEAKEPAVPDF